MCQFLSALLMMLVGLIILLPCPYSSPKMFCASPNFLSQPKTLTAFSASSKTFVPAQKPILLNANHLFVQHKKFGPAQNVLGPVKGFEHQKEMKNWIIKCGGFFFLPDKSIPL